MIVNGGWSGYKPWGTCSVTCGQGEKTRTRTCDSPAPANGGQACVGNASETGSCIEADCPGMNLCAILFHILIF